MRVLASLLAVAAATGALCAAAAQARSPLQIGAVVPELTVRSLVGPTIEKMTDSGLDGAGRVTLTWKRGQKALDPGQQSDLQYAVQQAADKGIDIYLTVYPDGPKDTPRTPAARLMFAAWVAGIVGHIPELKHVIIGNEPNINRFWLPQFDRKGKDVAAPAYELLLARSYDAIKAVAPSVEVIGGALSHMGINKRGSGRDTIAPQKFLLDLGKAYRETKRQLPIMDAFAFHPYLEHANLPPTYKHYSPRVITIADYGRLVSLLGRAFNGTAQRGVEAADRLRGVRRRVAHPGRAAHRLHRHRACDDAARERVGPGAVLRQGDADGRLPADRADVPRLPPDRRGDPRRLAIGRLLRERVTEGEPAGRRGGGAPPGGAAADRVHDAAGAEADGLVLPGSPPDARASRP